MRSVRTILIAVIFCVLCIIPALSETMTPERYQAALKPLLEKMDKVNSTGPFKPTIESLEKYTVPEWYKNDKFGIFIHYGPYTVPGFEGLGCWYGNGMYIKDSPTWKYHQETYGKQDKFGYKDLIPLLTAEKWNPDDWASLFKEAGARFVVPVSCFHDGYAMWDSKLTDWNAVKMGPKRDYDGQLAAAVRKQGMKFGMSWHRFFQPGFFGPGRNQPFSDIHAPNSGAPYSVYGPDTVNKEFMDDSLGRFVEMIDGYQPDLIWLDFDTGSAPREDLRRFAAYYFNRATEWKKGVAINDKHEDGVFPNCIVLDFERGKTSELKPYLWQTDTSVSWRDWSYVKNDSFKPVDLLIHELVDIVSKNGVLLLDVAPKPDGIIPEEPQKMLKTIGAWLKVNGDAIYNTRPCLALGFGEGSSNSGGGGFSDVDVQYTAQDWRFTQNGSKVYAISMAWPEKDDHFLVRSINKGSALATGGITSIKLLGCPEKLDWKLTDDGLWIKKPAAKPCEAAYAFQITTSGVMVEQLKVNRADDNKLQVDIQIRNLDNKPARSEVAFLNNGKPIGKESIALGKSETAVRTITLDSRREAQNETITAKIAGSSPFIKECVLFNPPAGISSIKFDGKTLLAGSDLGKLDKLTLSMWTKTDALKESWNALLNTEWKTGGMHFQYLADGRLESAFLFGRDNGTNSISRSAPGKAQGWLQVTLTYDSAARKGEVFINGKHDYDFTVPESCPVDFSKFWVGGWADKGRKFIGQIADVRLFDRVLTQAEIGSLINAKPITDGLVAAWDFKDQAGDTVKDTSGHGHDLKKGQ